MINKTFKTKNKVNFNYNKINYNEFIYLEVRNPIFGDSVVKPIGEYYTFINNERVRLSKFNHLIKYSDVFEIENNLPQITENLNVIKAIEERVLQFIPIILNIENNENNLNNWGLKFENFEEIVENNLN